MSVHIFGGFQAGKRTNSTLALNVATGSWSVLRCTGSAPSPRAYHAACGSDNFMFVHGGESQLGLTGAEVESSARQMEESAFGQSLHNSLGAGPRQEVRMEPSMAESVWNSTLVSDAAPALTGVCPGDSMGYQLRNPVNLVQGNEVVLNAGEVPRLYCLDDLHMLDTAAREWVRVACILAPLPRKGHSMVVANIEGKPHVVIFGGYSSDNMTLSNSIHVCEMARLVQYYRAAQTAARSNSQTISKIKALRSQESQIKPVAFRTLNCKGNVPAPRYRHSCTVVDPNQAGEQFLVVMGGIGKDPNAALCDVHVLNLQTLTWLPVNSEALSSGLNGEGPSFGIYGHSAFAVPSSTLASALPPLAEDAVDIAIPAELMVYGGSANATSGKSNCYRHIFGLDLLTYQWRRIRTGFAFPSARNNHSAAVVPGWAPSNLLPQGGARTSELSSSNAAVVIFGGVNSVMCASDTWALDLKWRPPGVDAFDGNTTQQVDEEVNHQATLRPVTSIEQQYLRASGAASALDLPAAASSPADFRSSIQAANDEKYMGMIRAKSGTTLPPKGLSASQQQQYLPAFSESRDYNLTGASHRQSSKMIGSRSYDFLGTANEQLNRELLHNTMLLATSESAGPEDQQVGHAFLRVRKERAMADIQLKEQVHRAQAAEEATAQLQAQFDAFRASSQQERERWDSEMAELKMQLERSLEREKQLILLNEESYELLLLAGINQA